MYYLFLNEMKILPISKAEKVVKVLQVNFVWICETYSEVGVEFVCMCTT